jgi:sortase A
MAIVNMFESRATAGPVVPVTEEPAPQEAARPAAKAAALVAPVSFAIATVLGGFLLYVFVLSGLGAGRAQTGLERRFEVPLSQGRAPVGNAISLGSPVARLDVPSIGIHQIVVEGTAAAQLQVGPGHVPVSPLPGQVGNSVIAAHRLAYGAPFSQLGSLRPGALITVVTGQGRFTYHVVRRYETGSGDVQPFAATRDDRLTLVTAANLSASRRLVIVAALSGAGKPYAPGRSSTLARADGGLVGQAGDFSALALWSLVLLVVAGVSVFVYRRLPRWSSYLATTPVILLALWLVYTNLGRVLPATL